MYEANEAWDTPKLARRAGLTQARIRQLLRQGRIRGYKLGRDWRIPAKEARRWLAQRAEDESAR